jgi:CubicO group peptidase (beta-lactamase class C family)
MSARGIAVVVVVVALAVALANSCATPPPERPASILEDIEYVKAHAAWRIRTAMAENDATAMAIVLVDANAGALAEGGGIVWANGFGRGELAGSVNADSVFRVGSISKLVTALITKQAQRDGVIDIDAPVSAALPKFAIGSRFSDNNGSGGALITPRHILTHHAGLPSDLLRGMYGSKRGDYRNVVDVMRDEFVSSPPRTVFAYSDAAYALLGHALEVAGAEDFSHRAERTLFARLGMAHTSFDRDGDVASQVIDGRMNGAPFRELGPTTTPANGLFTSASDLGRLMSAILRKDPVLHDVDDILRVQNGDVALDVGWRTGLGINRGPPIVDGGGDIAWHSGATIAFTTEVIMLPEEKLGVAVLINTAEAQHVPQSIAREVLALFLETKTGKRARAKGPLSPAPDAFTAAELKSFAGAYATDFGLMRFSVDGDKLRGRAFEETLELRPVHAASANEVKGGKAFDPWILGLGFVPVQPPLLADVLLTIEDVVMPDGATRKALVSTRHGVRMLRGVRVSAHYANAPLPPAWKARLGEYRNMDPGNDELTIERAQLVEEDGFLLIKLSLTRYPRPMVMSLRVIDDDEAVTDGYGRSMGETVRVLPNGRLRVVGYPLERISE